MFSKIDKDISRSQLIRYSILIYWSLFWLLNIIDKIIGGSHFLWVGRDRFAQFQKFFASAGLESPFIADFALSVAAALEGFAFVFFIGALFKLFKNKVEDCRSWFFIGISLTLATFTIFSIGDHIFGDRFELLEHTLFWFLTLFSWVVFNKLELKSDEQAKVKDKRQFIGAAIVAMVLISITSLSIFNYNTDFFSRRTDALAAEQIGEDIYKVSFPFLGGSTVFEKSIRKFKTEHPSKMINHIYTVPKPLRLKKADGLIFYIVTEDRP